MGGMFLLVTPRHFCPSVKKDVRKYQTCRVVMLLGVFFGVHSLYVPSSALVVAVWLPEAGGVQELSCHAKSSWTEAVQASRRELLRNPRDYIFQKTSTGCLIPIWEARGKDL